MGLYPKKHDKMESEQEFIQLKYRNISSLSEVINKCKDIKFDIDRIYDNDIKTKAVTLENAVSFLTDLLYDNNIREFGVIKVDYNQIKIIYK